MQRRLSSQMRSMMSNLKLRRLKKISNESNFRGKKRLSQRKDSSRYYSQSTESLDLEYRHKATDSALLRLDSELTSLLLCLENLTLKHQGTLNSQTSSSKYQNLLKQIQKKLHGVRRYSELPWLLP